MTYQEALKHFKSLQKRYMTQHNGVMCEKVKVAIEAIEKQIPKKPILHQYYEYEEDGVQSDYSYYTCANRCHKYCQVNPQDGFCRKCGQAIDWGDD